MDNVDGMTEEDKAHAQMIQQALKNSTDLMKSKDTEEQIDDLRTRLGMMIMAFDAQNIKLREIRKRLTALEER